MRGIYASISLEALKSKKYASEIASLKQQINEVEKHRKSLKEYLSEIRDRYKEYTEDIKLLEKFIQERRIVIKTLVGDYLSLEEAHTKLNALEDKLLYL